MHRACGNSTHTKSGTHDDASGPPAPARCFQIASRGLTDTAVANRSLSAMFCDLGASRISHRDANTGIRIVQTLLKSKIVQHRYGNGEPMQLAEHKPGDLDDSDSDYCQATPTPDLLAVEEQRLLAQLEAIRKERAAR